MNKFLMTGVALVAAMAMSEACALSLADASGKIGEAVENTSSITETVKQLAAADQVSYLAKVNEAISKLPGSAAEKAAKYLNANKAALIGAEKSNLPAMVAETFATVPPEALTVLNERLASDVFGRNNDPSKTVTDQEMVDIAKNLMSKVQARNEGNSDADVRNTFAALMLLRASGGKPADLADTLLGMYSDEKTRELAKTEWIPAAMAEGENKSYEPLLGASDAGEQPDVDMVMVIASAQTTVALLSDLNAAAATYGTAISAPGFSTPADMLHDPVGLDRVPRSQDPSQKWFGGYRRGDPISSTTGVPSEPGPYRWQGTSNY